MSQKFDTLLVNMRVHNLQGDKMNRYIAILLAFVGIAANAQTVNGAGATFPAPLFKY